MRLPPLSVTKCDEYLLQSGAHGVSKVNALRELLLRRGLTQQDLAAIGDAPNDAPNDKRP